MPAKPNSMDIAKKVVGTRFAAEVGSFGVFFGSAMLANTLLPKEMESLKDWVAKMFINQHLPQAEKVANTLKAFEGEDMAKERDQMNDSQKARYFADYLVDYAIKIPSSYLALFGLQHYLLKRYNLPAKVGENALAFAIDKGVELGSMYLFNTQIPEHIDGYRKSIAGILQSSTGMSAKHADEYARDTLNIIIPDSLGFGASTAYLYQRLCKIPSPVKS